ncbi:glycosyltransferase family 4 protein [Candidatus Saccharibacteria bacterium]|nr:glycosyltransferase family 4 protein [Candidatus Saccharibacteria bacterium]
MMKILMLGWELPPHNSGGLGVACLNMARALARHGVDIDFVVPYEAEHPDIKFMKVLSATHLDPIYRYGGGAYESLKLLDKIIPNGKNPNDLLSIRDVQKSYCEFVDKYLMEYKPELVHAHDWLTYEAGLLAKKNYDIPMIAHVHATEFDRAGMHSGNPIIHEIEYEGLMMADKIIAVSEATKRIVHQKYNIPLNKIDVVYNSLDENYKNSDYEFQERTYKFLLKQKEKGCTIVSTVGRFTVQKGLHNLIEAAALAVSKNPNLIFVFAGDGEERNELIELAANLGISKNVIFTGFIRGKRLRDVYAISDIFVMSSISEPFGLTALEAAHHGDALILTKQSGVAEVIWSAMTYDFWDERKLADEIVAISKNSALKESLQQNVMHEYDKISWNDVAKKCIKVYNNTIKHKRK